MVNGLEPARLPPEVRAWLEEQVSLDQAVVAFAPGRVNLIGAHLDYNEGPVQPIPLHRGTYVALRPATDGAINLVSRDFGRVGPLRLPEAGEAATLGWAAYPIGLARVLADQGLDTPGFTLWVAGDLDIGAGLSSSASLLVACARALNEAFSLGLDADQIAMAAYQAETTFVGVSCGIMDPMAASVARPGHTLLLDCRDRSYSHVPFDRERLALVVIDSGTRRTLTNSRFNERVAECRAAAAALRRHDPSIRTLRDASIDLLEAHAGDMSPAEARRARHVIREVARVYEFKDALAGGRLARCGELISACHRDLKELYEASTEPLDYLAETAVSVDGVLGARLAGAGWGGCVLALTEPGAEADLIERIDGEYTSRFGLQARFHAMAPA